MKKFKAVCINDKDQPKELPLNKRVVQEKIYTVIGTVRLPLMNNQTGFILEEIDLTDHFPYESFLSSRFAVILDDEFFAEEAVEELLEEVLAHPSLI